MKTQDHDLSKPATCSNSIERSAPEWAMRFLFLAACILSVWLAWKSLKHQAVPGCGMGSSCESILTSSWAWLGPVPVSLVGAVFYAVCAVFPHFRRRPDQKLRSRTSMVLFGCILCSVGFFVALQAVIIRRWCPWCCSIHGMGLSAVCLGLWTHHYSLKVSERPALRMLPNLAYGIFASLLVFCGGFSLLHAAEPAAKSVVEEHAAAEISPATTSAEQSSRMVVLHGRKFTFDLFQLPHEGLPNAKNVIISIIDPTCPHCRATGKTLHAAMSTYPPGEIAVLYLPGVRDAALGPAIQGVMLALWKEKPAAWLEIHQQLDDGKIPPDLESIRSAISPKFGGRKQLEAIIQKHREWSSRQIETTTALMVENSAGKAVTLPQTIIGKKYISGAITEGAEVQLWAGDQFKVTAKSPIKFQADPSDPCRSSSRNVCGRLIIALIGAGKMGLTTLTANGPNWDPIGAQAANHLKQFSPNNSNILVQGVAISSDQDFNEFMPFYFKGMNAKFVGTNPNSVDALKEDILAASDKSMIQKAIDNFEKDPACIVLKKKHGSSSAMPFVKTEILISAEYAESKGKPATTSWAHRADFGLASQWDQNPAYFEREDWRKMIDILKNSMVHTFITSCKATKLASSFELQGSADSCECFIASTASDQNDYSGSGTRPTWNYAMPDVGISNNGTGKNTWQGANNIYSMVPGVYQKNIGTLFFDSESGDDNPSEITSITYKKNPLMGFVYTSADALAEEALHKLPNGEAVLKAQFTAELPAPESSASPSVQAARVNEQISELENSYRPIFEESRKRLSATSFDRYYGRFADCANGESKDEKTRADCAALHELVDSTLNKPNKTTAEMIFAGTNDYFRGHVIKYHMRTLWQDYIAGTKPLAEVFPELEEIWKDYELYHKHLSLVATEISGDARKIDPKLEAALQDMNHNFKEAYKPLRDQVFEEMRREAMQVKIARLRYAVNGVANHSKSLPPGYADKFLKDISSKLNCLTQVAVGPKFDQNDSAK